MARKYPSVTNCLKTRPDSTLTAFLVLFEDQYETSFGDGKFHYLRGVCLTPEEARAFMEQNKEEWTRFHLRTLTIRLDHGVFEFPNFKPERYDRCPIMAVLTALEARSKA